MPEKKRNPLMRFAESVIAHNGGRVEYAKASPVVSQKSSRGETDGADRQIVEQKPEDTEVYWDALRTQRLESAKQEAAIIASNFSVVLQQGDSRYLQGRQITYPARQLREHAPEVAKNLVVWFHHFLTIELLDIQNFYSTYTSRTLTDERLKQASVDQVNQAIDGLTYPQYIPDRDGSNCMWEVQAILCPGGSLVNLAALKQQRGQKPLAEYARELEKTYAALGMKSRKFLQVPTWYANKI